MEINCSQNSDGGTWACGGSDQLRAMVSSTNELWYQCEQHKHVLSVTSMIPCRTASNDQKTTKLIIAHGKHLLKVQRQTIRTMRVNFEVIKQKYVRMYKEMLLA